MLMSPIFRVDATSTDGGGAITSVVRLADRRETSVFTCGGGATTAFGSAGIFISAGVRAVAASGTGIDEFDQATMLGSGTSFLSLMSGGVTIVCVRLSASGGTERMGCGARTGSPFVRIRPRWLRVSTGGR